MATGFRVFVPGETPFTDPTGLWQPVAETAQAFSIGRESPVHPADVTLWQVDLPENPKEASNLLNEQDRQLRQAEGSFLEAGSRLEKYSRQIQQGDSSFALLQRPSAERQLDGWLGLDDGASFGILPDLPQDCEQVFAQVTGFLKHASSLLSTAAQVETYSMERMIGRTTVAWSGDLQHAWLTGGNPHLASLHAQSLDLALRSRTAWMKMAALVITGGIKLVVVSSLSPLTAIPAVFKFIQQILNQAQIVQNL
jgi:hypothetical protein